MTALLPELKLDASVETAAPDAPGPEAAPEPEAEPEPEADAGTRSRARTRAPNPLPNLPRRAPPSPRNIWAYGTA